MESVVQSWVSANPGLKFNQLFQFLYFYTTGYFKTLETKTTIDPDKICKESFYKSFKRAVLKFLWIHVFLVENGLKESIYYFAATSKSYWLNLCA